MTKWNESPDVVVGIFIDRGSAQQAIVELLKKGFREDQIGMISPGEQATPAETTASEMAHATGLGAASGVGIGTAWALAVVSGALPPIGPMVAGGALASILVGAAGGGACGAAIGALVETGLSESTAAHYENELRSGKTLVLVHADHQYSQAAEILIRLGAETQCQGINDTGTVLPEHVRGPSP
jgi:hypothetical protein